MISKKITILIFLSVIIGYSLQVKMVATVIYIGLSYIMNFDKDIIPAKNYDG